MSHRTPLAKAEATGRILHDKKRFKNRREPKGLAPLGDPPKWLKKTTEREAWRTLSADLPWLNKSHRALVAIAAGYLGRLIAGEELPANAMNLLRLCVSSMGGSPADASRITLPDDEEDDEDPSKKYF